jgi:hypothetical protein
MAMSMKMTVVQDVAPCSLLKIDPRFRGTHCLYHHRLDEPDESHFMELSNCIFTVKNK